MPERRIDRRTKKRIACEVLLDGSRHSGMVIDVSKRGLFVQTNMRLRPGTRVGVRLKLPEWKEPLELKAKVARQKSVPSQLTTVAQGGLGLRVIDAPPVFAELIAAVQAGRSIGAFHRRERGESDESAPGGDETPAGKAAERRQDAGPERTAGGGAPAAGSSSGATASRAASRTGASGSRVRTASEVVRETRRRQRFSVRVTRPDGSEPSAYLVTAATEEGARARVLMELGEGWKVASIERV